MSDIKDKIAKLLKLAGNNPSENEAAAALALARKLMAEHNIAEEEVSGDKEIIEVGSSFRVRSAWKRFVGALIASKFRCEMFYQTKGNNYRVMFYGYKNDAEAAVSIFEYCVKYMERKAKEYVKEREDKRLKGDYIFGFYKGLQEEFDRQDREWESNEETRSLALIMKVPQVIQDLFDRYSENFGDAPRKSYIETTGDSAAQAAGKAKGVEFGEGLNRKGLENAR